MSVITVVRNGAKTLRNAVDSVVKQTFRNFEYLVVDGASTDETVSILQSYGDQIDYWLSEPDNGIFSAWNKALAIARGEWISFLGADDIYYATALHDYADAIASLTEQTEYISSRIELVKDGNVTRIVGRPWTWPAFSRYMTVAHIGSMHHRSLFERYGNFDDRYRSCGDYELLLRPRDKLKALFINRVTAKMTLGGISNANLKHALAEQALVKRITGKRRAWVCAIEQSRAHMTALCRAFLRLP